jgi:MFS family permease
MGLIAMILVVICAQFLRRAPSQKNILTLEVNTVMKEDPNMPIRVISLREATRSRQLWIICAMGLISGFWVHTVMVHIVLHATDIGVSAAASAVILSIIGILSTGSKIGMGSMEDRIGSRRVMIIVFILASTSFLGLRFASEVWMLYLFAAVFGVAYGGFSSVQSPMVAEYFDLRSHGAIFGVALFATQIGGSLGSLVAGRIFDISGSYHWAFILCTILSVAGLILSLLLDHNRIPKSKVT